MTPNLDEMIGRAARRESVLYTEHGEPEVVTLVAWRPHYKPRPGRENKRRSTARVIRQGAIEPMTVKCRFIQPLPNISPPDA